MTRVEIIQLKKWNRRNNLLDYVLVCRSYAEIVTLKVWQSRVAACVHTCDYMYGYKISQVDAQEFNLESSHKILYKNPASVSGTH